MSSLLRSGSRLKLDRCKWLQLFRKCDSRKSYKISLHFDFNFIALTHTYKMDKWIRSQHAGTGDNPWQLRQAPLGPLKGIQYMHGILACLCVIQFSCHCADENLAQVVCQIVLWEHTNVLTVSVTQQNMPLLAHFCAEIDCVVC